MRPVVDMELELGTRRARRTGRGSGDWAAQVPCAILHLDLELDMELDGPTGSNRFDTSAGAKAPNGPGTPDQANVAVAEAEATRHRGRRAGDRPGR